MKKILMLLALCGCANDRQDKDIGVLYVRTANLMIEHDRLLGCIFMLTKEMRVQDVVENLQHCVAVNQ